MKRRRHLGRARVSPLADYLRDGPLPWRWRLWWWWRTKIQRKPLIEGELGTFHGVRFIEDDD